MNSYCQTYYRTLQRSMTHTLLCLLAIATLIGCSGEQTVAPEETDGTQLVIMARGGSADPTDTDNHIKSLRLVITKQSSDALCFNKIFTRNESGDLAAPEGSQAKITEETGADGETIIKITESPFNFGSGNYNFYLIANEEGYYRADAADLLLSESLTDLKTATDANSLLGNPSVRIKIKEPGESHPILMSAAYQQWVYSQQDNRIGNIELVRSVARVDFTIKKSSTVTEDLTFSNIKLIGEMPDYFRAMEWESNYFEPTATGQSAEKVIAATAQVDKTITFYLPERLLRDQKEYDVSSALQIGITATARGVTNDYKNKIYIGPYEEAASSYTGYSIPRNTYYQINATIKKWDSAPYIEVKVLPWTYKKKSETFDVNYNVTTTGVNKEPNGIYYFSESSELEVTVSKIDPSDAECKAELKSDPEGVFAIDGTPTRTGATYTCRIKRQTGYTPAANEKDKISKLTLYIKINKEFYPIYLIKMAAIENKSETGK